MIFLSATISEYFSRILRTCFFSIQKIMSAHPSSPGVTLTLALFSVPAERALWDSYPSNSLSAVKERLLFWLHKNSKCIQHASPSSIYNSTGHSTNHRPTMSVDIRMSFHGTNAFPCPEFQSYNSRGCGCHISLRRDGEIWLCRFWSVCHPSMWCSLAAYSRSSRIPKLLSHRPALWCVLLHPDQHLYSVSFEHPPLFMISIDLRLSAFYRHRFRLPVMSSPRQSVSSISTYFNGISYSRSIQILQSINRTGTMSSDAAALRV